MVIAAHRALIKFSEILENKGFILVNTEGRKSMFQKENIISLEWKKRYESQPEEIKRELDDLSEAFDDYKVFKEKYQLKVIKRTRKLAKKGDIFVFSPREGIYFYGLVVKDDVKSDSEYNWYVIMLFKSKTNSLNDINFIPYYNDLLLPPLIVTRLYWTKGFFYNVGHLDEVNYNISYGFYDVYWNITVDEYDQKINYVPDYITSAGVMTDIGIAYEVNKELIINKDLLKF